MSIQYATAKVGQQIGEEKSQELASQLEEYLNQLLMRLDAYLDKRLVKAFVRAIAAIVIFRNQEQGLNLSELESSITQPSQAPVGMKRMDRLIKSPISQMGKGKRSWGHKLVWDFKKRANVKTGVVAVPIWHGETEKPLWVVIVRQKGEPWYLVTDIPIETEEQAWKIVFIYRRRWKIEMCFRYEKCELAIETLRLMDWEKREKLFLLVVLAYHFLLSLLSDTSQLIRE